MTDGQELSTAWKTLKAQKVRKARNVRGILNVSGGHCVSHEDTEDVEYVAYTEYAEDSVLLRKATEGSGRHWK